MGGDEMYTMQLQRLIILCRVRCLNLPRHAVIRLQGIVRPSPNINLHFHRISKRRTYIESFAVASEENICKGQSKHLSQHFSSYKLQPQSMPW
jgi:hypothetical protein